MTPKQRKSFMQAMYDGTIIRMRELRKREIRKLEMHNESFLRDCSPFKAKAHLKEIDAMFVRFNQYVVKKQQVRISLKVPKG